MQEHFNKKTHNNFVGCCEFFNIHKLRPNLFDANSCVV